MTMTIDAPRASGSAPTHVNRTFIAAPIETVWSILVATDKPLPFFFGAICDTKAGLHPGAKMRMVHPNRKIVMVVGEVLAFEPPRLYAHTFRMTHIDEPPATVTYRLTETAGGTDFELTIENARPGGRLEREMIGAQKFIGTNLKALAETGKPALTGRIVTLLSPLIAISAKTGQRIANWPLD